MTEPRPNPDKQKLKQLLDDAAWATSQVPLIGSHVCQIGAGPAWKSPLARKVHDQQLGPLADDVRRALKDLVDQLDDAHRNAPENLPDGVA